MSTDSESDDLVIVIEDDDDDEDYVNGEKYCKYRVFVNLLYN